MAWYVGIVLATDQDQANADALLVVPDAGEGNFSVAISTTLSSSVPTHYAACVALDPDIAKELTVLAQFAPGNSLGRVAWLRTTNTASGFWQELTDRGFYEVVAPPTDPHAP